MVSTSQKMIEATATTIAPAVGPSTADLALLSPARATTRRLDTDSVITTSVLQNQSRRQPSPSAYSRENAVKTEKSEELCRFFQKGKCIYGDECDYKHDSDTVRTGKSEQPCSFFQKGKCKKGEECEFKHDGSESEKPEQRGMDSRAKMDGRNTMALPMQPQQGMQPRQSLMQQGYTPAPESSVPQAQTQVQPQGNGFRFPPMSQPRAIKRDKGDESPPSFIKLEPEDH